jgi:hypothetical protein
LTCWLALTAAALHAQPAAAPTLDQVLDRLGAYLADYAEKLPATVASEHYVQWEGEFGHAKTTTLDSDFGIVRLPGVAEWLGFRDVQQKDGIDVGDRQQRLAAIFSAAGVDSVQQAMRVAKESALYNIGGVYRTTNNPAVVLELLDRRNRSRMRFRSSGDDVIDGKRARVVRFDERARPTVVRTTGGQDCSASGKAWIDPVDGTLLRVHADFTIHEVPGGVHASLDVAFAGDPKLGLWVPHRLREDYENDRHAQIAAGEAIYSNYRRFTVDTRVIVGAPPAH